MTLASARLPATLADGGGKEKGIFPERTLVMATATVTAEPGTFGGVPAGPRKRSFASRKPAIRGTHHDSAPPHHDPRPPITRERGLRWPAAMRVPIREGDEMNCSAFRLAAGAALVALAVAACGTAGTNGAGTGGSKPAATSQGQLDTIVRSP